MSDTDDLRTYFATVMTAVDSLTKEVTLIRLALAETVAGFQEEYADQERRLNESMPATVLDAPAKAYQLVQSIVNLSRK